MSDNRLLKQVFYSHLGHSIHSCNGQRKRYKAMMMSNLKACSNDPKELESLTENRSCWRTLCKASVQQFESDEVTNVEQGRATAGGFTCATCGRICACKIGLFFTPLNACVTRDSSCRRLSPLALLSVDRLVNTLYVLEISFGPS